MLPGSPGSSSSSTPLALRSCQVVPEILTGMKMPASNERFSSPLVKWKEMNTSDQSRTQVHRMTSTLT